MRDTQWTPGHCRDVSFQNGAKEERHTYSVQPPREWPILTSVLSEKPSRFRRSVTDPATGSRNVGKSEGDVLAESGR